MTLANKRFITTRAQGSSSELEKLLKSKGAELWELPAINISGTFNSNAIRIALQNIESFQWLVFTSINGVHYFFENLKQHNISFEKLNNIQFAVIGTKTGLALKQYNITANYTCSNATGDEFAQQLKNYISEKSNTSVTFLFPTSNLTANHLPEILSEIGIVTKLEVYQTQSGIDPKSSIYKSIIQNTYDAILFYSPSAVAGLLDNLNKSDYSKIRAACIGPTTAEKLQCYGIKPLTIAKQSDTIGIVKALDEYYLNPA